MNIHEIRTKSPTLHLTIWTSVAVFFIALFISIFLKVEIVAKGRGKIVPIGRVQSVQPEFSGSITQININNGDLVEKGDILIQFDSTEADSELASLNLEQQRLLIEKIRINTLIRVINEYKSITTSPLEITNNLFEVSSKEKTLAFYQEQKQLLVTQIEDYYNQKESIKKRILFNKHDIGISQSNIKNITKTIEFKNTRIGIVRDLVKNKVKPEIEYLELREELLNLNNQKTIYQKEESQKISRNDELKSEMLTLSSSTRNSLLQRKNEIEQRMNDLKELIRVANKKVKSSIIIAPATGIITQLKVFTIGGVAQAADELMRIVPINTKIEFEGVVSNEEFGFLEVGQKSNLKFDSFPSERFGFVKGVVNDISADSIELNKETGKWGFVVRITPEKKYLLSGNIEYSLKSGMTGGFDVITGERRIITYFFAPIVKTIQESLRER